MQMSEKDPENGVFLFDKFRKIIAAVYAFPDSLGKQCAILRQNPGSVAPTGRTVIQSGKERSDLFSRAMQLFVCVIGRKPFFQGQQLLVGARLRKDQPGKFRTYGVMQQNTCLACVGMDLPGRVLPDMCEYGIPYRLPLLEPQCQFLERKVVRLSYFGQVFPVCTGRIVCGD
jgi:hypothetical protein